MPRLLGLAMASIVVLAGAPVQAQVTDGDPRDLPVLSSEVPRGTGSAVEVEGAQPVPKIVDGDISDWVGHASLYGGTALYSAGEVVYQDHIFDAHGPDDGRDAERLAATGPLRENVPESYRIEALRRAGKVIDARGLFSV